MDTESKALRPYGPGPLDGESQWEVGVELRVYVRVWAANKDDALDRAHERAEQLIDRLSAAPDVDNAPGALDWSTFDGEEVRP